MVEVQTKQPFEVFPLDFKKFIVIGTKDGKLNPAATVVSAFALRLHTNLPTSQFVSNFRGGVAFKLI